MASRRNSIRSGCARACCSAIWPGSCASTANSCGRFSNAAWSIRIKDKFSALNAACWSGGTLLYVPKNVRLDEPVHSLSAMTDGGVDLGKTLVILEPGAEATLLTRRRARRRGRRPALRLDRVDRGAGAQLRYVNLQNWGHEVWHFAHQKAHVGREGRLQWTIGALGCRLAKVNQHVAMTGPDAEVQVNGVMFTEGRQHLSYNTHQHHMAPYCKSDLLYKTALQDRSRTVWRGMIKVDKPAQRTDAYQRNDNLMLSRDARADSIPGSGDRGRRCALHARQHERPRGRAAIVLRDDARLHAARSGADDRRPGSFSRCSTGSRSKASATRWAKRSAGG